MASPEQRGAVESNRHQRMLPVLFAVVIVDLIGFGIAIPILPYFADEFGASGIVLGSVLAIHAAMQFAFAPIWGRLSDRIGRRPVMLMTMAGTAVSLVLFGLAGSVTGLLVARALSGAFAANISVATAYVTDVTAESERTRWMGMIGASFGIGFLLGPAIGGWLAPYGHSVPVFAAAGMAVVNCGVGALFLREPERHASAQSGRLSLREIAGDAVLGPLCGINFLFTFGVTQLESIFAYWMILRFQYDARGVAWILVAMALVMAMIQGGGMRALAGRFGERALLLGGLALMALAFPLVPAAGTVALLMGPLLFAAIGRAIAQPPMLSLVSMRAEVHNRGRVMGAFQSSASLARVFGPIAAGLLFDFDAPLPFYLASACFALAAGVAVRAARPDAQPE
jgi:DHA1 family tetracycline resistance protein-like MFS transporter